MIEELTYLNPEKFLEYCGLNVQLRPIQKTNLTQKQTQLEEYLKFFGENFRKQYTNLPVNDEDFANYLHDRIIDNNDLFNQFWKNTGKHPGTCTSIPKAVIRILRENLAANPGILDDTVDTIKKYRKELYALPNGQKVDIYRNLHASYKNSKIPVAAEETLKWLEKWPESEDLEILVLLLASLTQYCYEKDLSNRNGCPYDSLAELVDTYMKRQYPVVDPDFEVYMNDRMRTYERQNIKFSTPQLLAAALKYPDNPALTILNHFDHYGDYFVEKIYAHDRKHLGNPKKAFEESPEKDFYAQILKGSEKDRFPQISPCIFCYYLLTSGGSTEDTIFRHLGAKNFEQAKTWMREEYVFSLTDY